MRIRKGPWDGAQMRTHVLAVLRKHGVEVNHEDGDWYELVDADGDPEVMLITNPVMPDVVIKIWERFGELHAILITELAIKH